MARMELLSPAGGMEQLEAALRFGADAVYGGLKRFGLRASAGNFDWDELERALRLTHEKGARFYVTLNVLPYDDELEALAESAEKAFKMGVDAAIVSDPGAVALLRRRVPGLLVHVSTQANVMNSETAAIFTALGVKRIVVSRELSLERVRRLKEKLPEDVEVEAFVHGAMCMAHSGRCMMSDHIMGRGGNRGACAQPCRWEYIVTEVKRPNEPMPVLENEEGTYIFSAYDLNMLSHLPEMRDAGIISLKIEGRMKTAYYVASVTRIYREALDLLERDEDAYRAALPRLEEELLKVSHRASNTGFYFGRPQPSSGADGFHQTMEFSGKVLGCENGMIAVEVRNRFEKGDVLEAVTPHGVIPIPVEKMIREDGTETDFVSIAGSRVFVAGDAPVEKGDYLRGINRNHLRK
ncbi:MAG: U32 family peptidase [Clostridia bacterium]|nr:U32 family peptidase [Clostridia bacterium]